MVSEKAMLSTLAEPRYEGQGRSGPAINYLELENFQSNSRPCFDKLSSTKLVFAGRFRREQLRGDKGCCTRQAESVPS